MRIKFSGRHRGPSTLVEVWQRNIDAARSNVKEQNSTPFVDLWNSIAHQEIGWLTYEAGVSRGNNN